MLIIILSYSHSMILYPFSSRTTFFSNAWLHVHTLRTTDYQLSETSTTLEPIGE